jgi:hypothetical protein
MVFHMTPSSSFDQAADALARLTQVIESRKPSNGGDPAVSYVSKLLHKGPNAFLKKIGEEVPAPNPWWVKWPIYGFIAWWLWHTMA